jgi:hypothetical protein
MNLPGFTAGASIHQTRSVYAPTRPPQQVRSARTMIRSIRRKGTDLIAQPYAAGVAACGTHWAIDRVSVGGSVLSLLIVKSPRRGRAGRLSRRRQLRVARAGRATFDE